MVTNIGFGTDETHTTGADPDRALASVPIETPLVHPPAVIPMRSLDEIDQRLAFLSLPVRIRLKSGSLRRRLIEIMSSAFVRV